MFRHGSFQACCEILFEGRVFDDWDSEHIVVPEHSFFTTASWDAFDLLNMGDLKACIVPMQFLDQKRYKHCPFTVCVNRAAGSMFKSCQKQRRAS